MRELSPLRAQALGLVLALLPMLANCTLLAPARDDYVGAGGKSAGNGGSGGSGGFGGSGGGSGGDAGAGGSAPCDYRVVVLSDGPVAYWPLGDVDNGVANDLVGERDGTVNGSRSFAVADLVEQSCDGAAQIGNSIVIGQHLGFSGQAPFTLEAWAQLDNYDGGTVDIVVKRTNDDVGPGDEGYVLAARPAELFFRRVHDDSPDDILAPPLQLGQRYYVVATYDGAQMCLYVNAQLIDSCVNSSLALDTHPDLLRLGGSGYEGILDEIAIYDKALSAGQVQAHYDSGTR